MIVTGMHRSGTSAITRTINLLGVPTCNPTDLIRDRTDNLRGHWESQTVTDWNEELLRLTGARWWCPPPLDTDWSALVEEHRRAAAEAFAAVHPTHTWVWKDPRTCLTLPFWQAILPQKLAFVLVVRHPQSVAASLRRRNGFTREAGVALWEVYITRAAAAMTGTPVLVCCYDAAVEDPARWAQAASAFLAERGVPLGGGGSLIAAVRSIEPSLAHHARPADDGVIELTESQRALLRRLDELEGSHEHFAARVPPVSPATERFFAEKRHELKPEDERPPHPQSGMSGTATS